MKATVKMLLTALFSLAALFAMAAENLLPKVETTNKIWYQARNAVCQCEFAADAAQETLKLTIHSDKGYANYRTDLTNPEAGFHTLDVLVRQGDCVRKAAGVEVYAFDADGKAKLLCMKYLPAGKIDNARLSASINIPAGTVKLRIGMCLNAKGFVEFVAPALYKGKLNDNELPKR